jgi:hypothetical protein
MRRLATRALLAVLAVSSNAATGCARAAMCDGVSCAASCPRDAQVDASGRCACADGDVPLLAACVPPAIGEAYCGPAEHIESGASGGCAFRSCEPGQSLDLVTGACVPRGSLAQDGPNACAGPAIAIVEAGRAACAAPEATCPRGTRPSDPRDGKRSRSCDRPPACPPGSLADGSLCRPVVTGVGRVDVGAWAALALGVHGGPGSPALCQPLVQRPSLFGGLPGAIATTGRAGDGGMVDAAPGAVRVAMAIVFPDQDVSRVHARVRARDASGHPLSAVAEAFVSGAVGTALEALRGLGGEASAASVELEVTCAVGGVWGQ